MKTHQSNPNAPTDEHFVDGDLKYLVIGNECRLLDKRRTPGTITEIDLDGGFFRWKIDDFEDKGRFWDVTFERIGSYQFGKSSKLAEPIQIALFQDCIARLDQTIEIFAEKSTIEETNRNLLTAQQTAQTWLEANSQFFNQGHQASFQSRTGPASLRMDFNSYMATLGLTQIENQTADLQVMNPHSGDWVKGMQIVMAEMGLKPYKGKQVRSPRAFVGEGAKEQRRKYILHRLGFLRAIFRKMDLAEIELYRGMSTEWDWKPDTTDQYRFWSSWTFNHDVARDFSELTPGTKHKNSYLLKRAMPIQKVFMTFLETDAMNRQYPEAEAIVLHDEGDRLLW